MKKESGSSPTRTFSSVSLPSLVAARAGLDESMRGFDAKGLMDERASPTSPKTLLHEQIEVVRSEEACLNLKVAVHVFSISHQMLSQDCYMFALFCVLRR